MQWHFNSLHQNSILLCSILEHNMKSRVIKCFTLLPVADQSVYVFLNLSFNLKWNICFNWTGLLDRRPSAVTPIYRDHRNYGRYKFVHKRIEKENEAIITSFDSCHWLLIDSHAHAIHLTNKYRVGIGMQECVIVYIDSIL